MPFCIVETTIDADVPVVLVVITFVGLYLLAVSLVDLSKGRYRTANDGTVTGVVDEGL